jgi:integrase
MRNLIIGDMDFKELKGKTISKWVDKSIKLDFVFSHQTSEYIKEYLGERIENKNDYVFVDLNGKQFKYFRTWELFNRLREITGINIWQHRFRHAFATDLIKKHKMRPKQAMLLTRHKHLSSFERYLDEDYKEAAQAYHNQGGLEIHEIDRNKQKKQEKSSKREKS